MPVLRAILGPGPGCRLPPGGPSHVAFLNSWAFFPFSLWGAVNLNPCNFSIPVGPLQPETQKTRYLLRIHCGAAGAARTCAELLAIDGILQMLIWFENWNICCYRDVNLIQLLCPLVQVNLRLLTWRILSYDWFSTPLISQHQSREWVKIICLNVYILFKFVTLRMRWRYTFSTWYNDVELRIDYLIPTINKNWN